MSGSSTSLPRPQINPRAGLPKGHFSARPDLWNRVQPVDFISSQLVSQNSAWCLSFLGTHTSTLGLIPASRMCSLGTSCNTPASHLRRSCVTAPSVIFCVPKTKGLISVFIAHPRHHRRQHEERHNKASCASLQADCGLYNYKV